MLSCVRSISSEARRRLWLLSRRRTGSTNGMCMPKSSTELAEALRSHRYFRVSRKDHTTAKEAPRRAIAIVADDLPAPHDETTSSFKSGATFPERREG